MTKQNMDVSCQDREVEVNSDGLRFWKKWKQDQGTFQLLRLASAEKGAESRKSQEPVTPRSKYDMSGSPGSPRGTALIINNKNFPDDVRTGTDKDRDALCKLWVDLDFKTTVLNDLNAKEMRVELEKLAKLADDPCKAYKCVVVCILSHGWENFVCGSDNNRVPIDKVVELFHNDKVHESLDGKPKLFFIQACRGDKDGKDAVADSPTASPADDLDKGAVPDSRATFAADILVCNATAQGYSAWRDDDGSWYIKCLVEVFHKHHKEEHVEDMMTRVNEEIREQFKGGDRQAPWKAGSLRKDVFLP